MILFRADANKNIGSGHVMRCLSIADRAAASGEQCVILTASSDLEDVIIAHGHKAAVLNSAYDCMGLDLDKMQNWIKDCLPSAFLIDSYYVSRCCLASLQKCCKDCGTKLVYVDDLLAFPYPCDVLINYNIYAADKEPEYRKMYGNAPVPQLLLGPAYTPLRDEFQNIGMRNVKKNGENVLISTGGADFEHLSLKLVHAINACADKLSGLHFHFVIGAMNQDVAAVQKIAASSQIITAHRNVQKMSQLMVKCDLAVSAAGSTLYELCAAQTPAITYILADNQILGAEGFERCGIMKCAGDIRQLGAVKLAGILLEEIRLLADRYEERVQTAERQRRIVDGKGTQRILKAVLNLAGR